MFFHNLLDYGNEYIEKLSVDEDKARNCLLLIDSSINKKIKLREEFDFQMKGNNLIVSKTLE